MIGILQNKDGGHDMKGLLRSALLAGVGLAATSLNPGCFSTGTFVDQLACASDADCDDNNLCTADVCDEDARQCTHAGTNVGARCGGDAMTCDGKGQCAACASDDDCGVSTSCAMVACVDHACKVTPSAAGTVLVDDTPGDCELPQCDGQGAVVHVPDASDVPASADACTQYACSDQGGPIPSYAVAGAACDGGVCDGAGACVACTADTDCGGGAYCHEHVCASCSDGAQNGDEAGLDCGGAHCLKCNGESCSASAECKSASCSGAGISSKCGWPVGVPCAGDDQCASLQCQSGACTAP